MVEFRKDGHSAFAHDKDAETLLMLGGWEPMVNEVEPMVQCLRCSSQNLEASPPTVNYGSVTIKIKCNSCSQQFYESYKLQEVYYA